MGTHLRHALKRLCLDSEWKFAIFWKFNNCFPMVLACEDVYYNNDENFDLFGEALLNYPIENSLTGYYVADPLRLAVAKMSAEVYYLGDGIIGKVGLTGLHEWFFPDTFYTNSWPYIKHGAIDGWQAQLSAGVKTILAVAVLPLGVVQLGSLYKVNADLALVSHIRNTFLALEGVSSQPSCNPIRPLFKESARNCTSAIVLGPKFWQDNQHQIKLSDHINSEYWREKSSTLWQIPQVSSFEISRSHGSSSVRENVILHKETDFKGNLSEINLSTPLKSSTSSELHEAFGSSFQRVDKTCDSGWGKIESEIWFEGSEGVADSCLMHSFSSDNLLDAVVANVFRSANDVSSETLFCKPTSIMDHLSTADNTSPSTVCTSSSRSTCNEQVGRPNKAASTHKRARIGENCRPRPRDRQLIQDRIKELRELVPNGAKCSIDFLLERTAKYILFLQCVTEHADKIKECAESKFRSKTAGISGLTYEQGSSWVMEVGDEQEVFPIVVEDLNNTGQFIVELLCEEYSQFLKVAEFIRNLGLTILKGLAEARGDKTEISFIVEFLQAPKDRSMHRMDILLSLVHLLEPRIATC